MSLEGAIGEWKVKEVARINAIKARMTEMGIGAQALAHHLKMSRQRVYQIISGDETSFQQDTIDKICEALACREEDLFEMRSVRRRMVKMVDPKKRFACN